MFTCVFITAEIVVKCHYLLC